MKLLVTGGAGYIGGVVATQLLAAGHEVTVLDNLSKGHREAVPAGARFVEADVLDEAVVRAVADEGFDGVLHFAAPIVVPESVAQPERYFRVIVGGSLNLLDAMRAAGVGRIVFSSSSGGVWAARRDADHRDGGHTADESLRLGQAGGGPPARRGGPRPWVGGGEPALLQCRRRQRVTAARSTSPRRT